MERGGSTTTPHAGLCVALRARPELGENVYDPLTVGDPERHRARLIRTVPEWAPIQLKHSAKYLGFILGPERGELSFGPAVQKFRRRTLQWQAAAGGSNLSLMAYRVYILPILQFLIQLDNPPADCA